MFGFCDYTVKVLGSKIGCYAFWGSMPAIDEVEIVDQGGTVDTYYLEFKGSAKYSVDEYCKPWQGSFSVDYPEKLMDIVAKDELTDADLTQINIIASNHYYPISVQERSKLFAVEVICNSTGDGYMHYINGELYEDECTDEMNYAEDEWPLDVQKVVYMEIEWNLEEYPDYEDFCKANDIDSAVVTEDMWEQEGTVAYFNVELFDEEFDEEYEEFDEFDEEADEFE